MGYFHMEEIGRTPEILGVVVARGQLARDSADSV